MIRNLTSDERAAYSAGVLVCALITTVLCLACAMFGEYEKARILAPVALVFIVYGLWQLGR